MGLPLVKPRTMKGGKMKSLDNLFSKIIRTRDGKCLRCGKTEQLQCSHVVPRTFISTRWNTENAITLCYACHIHWWHKNPLEAAEWFESKWPGRWKALYAIANKHEKINREETYETLKTLARSLPKS